MLMLKNYLYGARTNHQRIQQQKRLDLIQTINEAVEMNALEKKTLMYCTSIASILSTARVIFLEKF